MRHAISAGRQLSVGRFYLLLLVCVILVSAGRAAAPADGTESTSPAPGEAKEAPAALLKCALRVANQTEQNDARAGAKLDIARKLADLGRTDEAAKLLSEVRETVKALPPAVRVFGFPVQIPGVYARMGRFEEALSLADKEDRAASVQARCRIASAMFRAGKGDMGLRVMKVARRQMAELEEPGALPNVVAEAYARGAYYGRALEIARETQEDWNKAGALSVIAAQWMKSGGKRPPENVISGLIETTKDIGASEHESHALRYIAEAFAKAGEVEKALWLCDRISDSEYRVKVKMCAAEALIEEGDIDRALNLLDEPYEMARDLHGVLPPSKITGLYARAGRYERALELVRTASEHSGWLSEALAWVARVRAEKGDMEAGMETLSKALEMAVEGANKPVHPDFPPPEPPDAWQMDGNLKAVATTWAGAVLKNPDSRILNEALKTIARIERPWDRITALKKLADICGQIELVLDQESREILDDICSAKSSGEKNEETGSQQK